jgi:hypothetical protein
LPGAGSTTQQPSWASKVNWGNVVATGVPLVASLFAGDRGSTLPDIRAMQAQGQALGQQGQQLSAQGAAAMGPSLDYFKKLLSNDPAEVAQATAPERRRVIDQYDTARRSAGQFTPRGGGQASTSEELRAREASDLATIGADLRSKAASEAATIGNQLLSSGLGAQEQSINAMASSLGPLFTQQQADSQSTLQTIAGIAALAAMFI